MSEPPPEHLAIVPNSRHPKALQTYTKKNRHRDLETKRYYSKENVQALREIYRTKIYPKLWSDSAAPAENEERIRSLEERVAQYEQVVEAILDGKINVNHIRHA